MVAGGQWSRVSLARALFLVSLHDSLTRRRHPLHSNTPLHRNAPRAQRSKRPHPSRGLHYSRHSLHRWMRLCAQRSCRTSPILQPAPQPIPDRHRSSNLPHDSGQGPYSSHSDPRGFVGSLNHQTMPPGRWRLQLRLRPDHRPHCYHGKLNITTP